MKEPIYKPNLLSIPDGLYPWRKKKKYGFFFEKTVSYGWLEVSTDKNTRDFMWTSNKNTHDPTTSPAKNLTLDKNTGLVKFYMESAISMWIKWSVYKTDDTYLEKMLNFIKDIEYFMLEEE